MLNFANQESNVTNTTAIRNLQLFQINGYFNEKIYIAQPLLVLHTLPKQGMQLEYSKLQLRTSVCFETDQGHGLLHQNEHY